ncbi:hypothetical protein [uncultured Methylobacterium sp.]|nr:hypothetical protein [uncultured Methylobacterium sp.]
MNVIITDSSSGMISGAVRAGNLRKRKAIIERLSERASGQA